MVAAWQSVAARSESLGADPVVTKPTGTVDGDLLIAVGILSGAGTITAPAGWTTHPSSLGAASPLFTKVASSEPANYTFVVSSTFTSQIAIVRVNNQAASSAIDAASGQVVASGTANIVMPSITSAGANRLLMQICVRLQNTTFTGPGSQTERFDAVSVSQSAVYAGGDETVGSGATGTRTWTSAASGGFAVGYMLAIAPVPPEEGTFTGAYDFTGSGFTGDAPVVPPNEGDFVGGYDFSGTDFVGVAGAPSAYGSFSGGYAFDGSGFTGSAPSPPFGDGRWTPGGRDRFTARRTPKNRRRSR